MTLGKDGAMPPKSTDKGIITKPPQIDADWATKIEKAKEAREEGRKARAGKPVGVYRPRFVRKYPA